MKRLLILLIWFVFVVVLKLPSKLSFGLVILTTLASFVIGLAGGEGFALRLITYAYGFGVIGIVAHIREIRKNVEE